MAAFAAVAALLAVIPGVGGGAKTGSGVGWDVAPADRASSDSTPEMHTARNVRAVVEALVMNAMLFILLVSQGRR